MQLTSSAFTDGAEIPRKYGYKNGNVSPPLTIKGIPRETKSLTLIMDDPDAMGAVGKVWVHWVAYNISPNLGHEFDAPFGQIEIPESKASVSPITLTDWEERTATTERFNEFLVKSYGQCFCMLGVNGWKEFAYGGPAPPDKRHTYVFKLYALDVGGYNTHKNRGGPVTKSGIENYMEGHIIEQTQLTGTYAP